MKKCTTVHWLLAVALAVMSLFFATASQAAETCSLNFKWSANTDNPTGYRIYYWTLAEPTPVQGYQGSGEVGVDDLLHASVEDLSYETDYYFIIRAYNSAGESPDSDSLGPIRVACPLPPEGPEPEVPLPPQLTEPTGVGTTHEG